MAVAAAAELHMSPPKNFVPRSEEFKPQLHEHDSCSVDLVAHAHRLRVETLEYICASQILLKVHHGYPQIAFRALPAICD